MPKAEVTTSKLAGEIAKLRMIKSEMETRQREGSATAARVRRLIAAPAPIGRARTVGGVFSVAALAAFPLILLASPAVAVIGRHYCPPAVTAPAVPGHCPAAGCEPAER